MNEKQSSLSGQTGTSTMASGAGLTTSQTTGAASGAGKAIVQDAKQVASEVAGQAKQQVATKIEDKKDKAAQGLSSVATAIRQTGESLRDHDQLGVMPYVDGVADQIERLSDYVMTSDVGQIVGEAESFARREPVIFLGGAFLLGLVGARFLKASAPAPTYEGGYLGENSYDYIRDEPRSGYGRGERVSYGGSYGTREGVRTQQQYATGTGGDYRSGQMSERGASAGGTYGAGSSYGSGAGSRNVGSEAGTGSRGGYGSGTSTGGTYGAGSGVGSGASTGGTSGVTPGVSTTPAAGLGLEGDVHRSGKTLPGTGKPAPDKGASSTGQK